MIPCLFLQEGVRLERLQVKVHLLWSYSGSLTCETGKLGVSGGSLDLSPGVVLDTRLRKSLWPYLFHFLSSLLEWLGPQTRSEVVLALLPCRQHLVLHQFELRVLLQSQIEVCYDALPLIDLACGFRYVSESQLSLFKLRDTRSCRHESFGGGDWIEGAVCHLFLLFLCLILLLLLPPLAILLSLSLNHSLHELGMAFD